MSDKDKALLFLIAARLERIMADSQWAHRSGGIRGSILRTLDQIDNEDTISSHTEKLLKMGFNLLKDYARQIPNQDSCLSSPHKRHVYH